MIILLTLLVIVLLVLLLTLFNRVNTYGVAIDRLDRRIAQLERAGQPGPTPTETPSRPVMASVPAGPASATPQPSAPPPPSAPPLPLEPPRPATPSRTREEFEAFVGGKLLNRIGALALIIGVGFFLKYAFDNAWIGETARVGIGVAIGAALLAGGMRSHAKSFVIFAQGLFGAGLSILYLSVFASFNFYHLLPQFPAFAAMSAVTAIGVWVALRYDAFAIACLAAIGGFLTPFLLSTGEANAAGLLTYLALLSAGLLAVALRRSAWRGLPGVTLFGTAVVYAAWLDSAYTSNDLGVALPLTLLLWALFAGFSFRELLLLGETESRPAQIVALANAALTFLAIRALLEPAHHGWTGTAVLLLGVPYAAQAVILRRRAGTEGAAGQSLTAAMSLLVFATAIQWERFAVVALWSLEAAALAWCGRRWNARAASLFAPALLLVALLDLLSMGGAFRFFPLTEFTPLWNLRAAAFAALACASFIVGELLWGTKERSLHMAASALPATGAILLFLLIVVEVNDTFLQAIAGTDPLTERHLLYLRFLALSVGWSLYVTIVLIARTREHLRSLTLPGLSMVAVTLLVATGAGIAYAPIECFTPLLNFRAAALLLVVAATAFQATLLRKDPPEEFFREAASATGAAALLLGLVLLTGETRDYFESRIAAEGIAQSGLEDAKQLALSGLWLCYGGMVLLAGIWRRIRGLRLLGIALLGIAILKIFVYDLSFLEAIYRIASFIGLGVILLAASYLYQRYKGVIVGDDRGTDGGS